MGPEYYKFQRKIAFLHRKRNCRFNPRRKAVIELFKNLKTIYHCFQKTILQNEIQYLSIKFENVI